MARSKGVILWLAAPALVAVGGYELLSADSGSLPAPLQSLRKAVDPVVATASKWLFSDPEQERVYRFARVEEGEIVSTVSASGTIQPVTTVLVGSQLSGQVRELLADFNSPVKAGQVIARLDADQIRARLAASAAEIAQASAGLITARAQVARSRADLDTALANVANAQAQLQRAESQALEADRDWQRKRELVARGAGTLVDAQRAEAAAAQARAGVAAAQAQTESVRAAQIAAEANLHVVQTQIASAEAQVEQRRASMQQIEVDLERSEIRAPIEGVVIRRDVDVGQTVAASLQAPVLFTIAQDLRQIEVHVAVDEADVGRVRPGQAALFTVAAYPTTTFRGEVLMTRLGAQTIQNVVTYTVVIGAENRDQRLLPGMTATVRIVTDRREQAIKVPNAALRWRPPGASRAPEGGAVPAAAAPTAGGGAGGWPGLDQLQPMLTRELALDADQQRNLGTIVDDARRQFRELRGAGLPPDQLRARMRAARQQIETRISDTLRPEQKTAFERWRAERMGGATSAPLQGRVFVLGADGAPRAIALRLGIGDGGFTEIVGGDVRPGQELVIGGGPRPAAASTGAPTSSGPRFGF